jgi:hypothetical protein
MTTATEAAPTINPVLTEEDRRWLADEMTPEEMRAYHAKHPYRVQIVYGDEPAPTEPPMCLRLGIGSHPCACPRVALPRRRSHEDQLPRPKATRCAIEHGEAPEHCRPAFVDMVPAFPPGVPYAFTVAGYHLLQRNHATETTMAHARKHLQQIEAAKHGD